MPPLISFHLSTYGPIRRPPHLHDGLHTVPEGTTVADFLSAYFLLTPAELPSLVIHVNNSPANLSYTLHNGDHLTLFLPVGGGR
ncbi:MAG: MoaD/ThiS family protein [bacterium]|nr:MoaD/ThiS family protein [bacterium]